MKLWRFLANAFPFPSLIWTLNISQFINHLFSTTNIAEKTKNHEKTIKCEYSLLVWFTLLFVVLVRRFKALFFCLERPSFNCFPPSIYLTFAFKGFSSNKGKSLEIKFRLNSSWNRFISFVQFIESFNID